MAKSNEQWIGLAVAGVAAWWLYDNWASLTASVSTALTPAVVVAPVTLTPAQLANVAGLQSQAAIAQQQADEATAAGNPNAAILQAQATNLATAAATAQVESSTAQVSNILQSTGLSGMNRRFMRRAA